jgi:hypothetical protein
MIGWERTELIRWYARRADIALGFVPDWFGSDEPIKYRDQLFGPFTWAVHFVYRFCQTIRYRFFPPKYKKMAFIVGELEKLDKDCLK